MKLYTEEQVIQILEFVQVIDKNIVEYNEFIKKLTPIELPSDEEIELEAKRQWGNVHRTGVLGFINCAKWLKNKIQGGNQ